MKPRNAERFTASSTETSGVRPAAGRKPASASSTERREGEDGSRPRPSASPGGCFILSETRNIFVVFVLFLHFYKCLFYFECVL